MLVGAQAERKSAAAAIIPAASMDLRVFVVCKGLPFSFWVCECEDVTSACHQIRQTESSALPGGSCSSLAAAYFEHVRHSTTNATEDTSGCVASEKPWVATPLHECSSVLQLEGCSIPREPPSECESGMVMAGCKQ